MVDNMHRTSIGYETFFLSDEDAKRRFDGNVTKYCGILTDPVTKHRFRPHRESPRTLHGDRRYFFASDSTREIFAMMPEMYADPAYMMLPKAEETAKAH